jgi:hypothetical protein
MIQIILYRVFHVLRIKGKSSKNKNMAMVHRILCGRGSLDSNQWFERTADSVRATGPWETTLQVNK